ncbi:MAG: hypothetical protein VB125_02820 [Burkholderia sp.]
MHSGPDLCNNAPLALADLSQTGGQFRPQLTARQGGIQRSVDRFVTGPQG